MFSCCPFQQVIYILQPKLSGQWLTTSWLVIITENVQLLPCPASYPDLTTEIVWPVVDDQLARYHNRKCSASALSSKLSRSYNQNCLASG
ncbi:hypothetical protein TNIN_151211 [Trichonephila inaurata madagascariensis]|uniref:Uncharacterized protein n=1 Tax=Trichonephila inaurata madagascariensis TaxID=2747483 RepID=A0A8X6YA40_9ARAC|nr:hypothetical protein TNIN_151211 [Trichonephila inaurata madagascariensis]